MESLLATAMWTVALAYAVHRLAVAWERTAALRVPGLPSPPAVVEIPEDLLAVAMQETESWAQEEVVRAIREKYELFGDWNRVRSSFGVGRRD